MRSFRQTSWVMVACALAGACAVAPERSDDGTESAPPTAAATASATPSPTAPSSTAASPAAEAPRPIPDAQPMTSPAPEPATPPLATPPVVSPPVDTPPVAAPPTATPPVATPDAPQAPTPPAAPPVAGSPLEGELAGIVDRVVREGVVVVLDGGSFVDTVPPRIAPAAYPTLERIVSVLKRDAERRAIIVAYNESPGSRDYNIALAERRANVVRQYLVDQGVRPLRITVRPYGDMRPATASRVADAGPRGRRVEVIIGRMPPRAPTAR